MVLELKNLPPHVDETFIKHNFFEGQHLIKFETLRDNLSGRCRGRGLVELRCPTKEDSSLFIDALKSKGVQFEVKAIRNLRKEGPTTVAVAANP